MITAKEIQKQQRQFEKVKLGYNPEEVDALLAQIVDDLRGMQQEMAESEEKIQLLADKVREYKETEEDLKNALLSAQKQAREVIKAANEKAAQIEADAQVAVEAAKSEALLSQEEQLAKVEAQLAAETKALADAKSEVAAFKHSLFDMYKNHLEMISLLPDDDDDEDEEPEEAEESDDAAEAEEMTAETEGITEVEAAEIPAEAAESDAEEIVATAESVVAEVVEDDPFQAAVNNSTFESRRDDIRRRF